MKILTGLDLTCAAVSLLFVTVLPEPFAAKLSLDQLLGVTVKVSSTVFLLLFLYIWYLVLCRCKLYDPTVRLTVRKEVAKVSKATLAGTGVILMLCVTFRVTAFELWSLPAFCASTAGLSILVRLLLRCSFVRFWPSVDAPSRIVIAGTHQRAIDLANDLSTRPELAYCLDGFIDAPGEIHPELEKRGYSVVADFTTFPDYLRKNPVDEVFICLPVKSLYKQATQLAAVCEEHGIVVSFITDIFHPKLARTTTQHLLGRPIVTFYTGRMVGRSVAVKRILDFVMSLLLIIVFSPLMLLTAALIKLTSKGPVFFVQRRLGLNKHEFNVYKFRTMHLEAEKKIAELEHLNEMTGPVFKIKNDPRVTLVGRYLRATSIDELPQLFNILLGDMSLVGPRPLALRDCNRFHTDWHRRRFSVRPGITCLWQVSGRNDIPFEKWMELDMQYIDNWSLWLDLKILVKTIPAVLKGSGAS